MNLDRIMHELQQLNAREPESDEERREILERLKAIKDEIETHAKETECK